ncbi:XF1762 family protein [Nonomuraea sp. NPDC049400]|uniref:XF1762 family protein n=1 Tax=Nonomuraea sp. NPDC049400 TaxID=3364352 RepID=UPI0037B33416
MTKLITAPPATNTTTLSHPAEHVLDDVRENVRTGLSQSTPAPRPTYLGGGDPPHPPTVARGSADNTGRLTIVPIALRTARAFIAWSHRHLLPPRGAKFAIGVSTEDGTLVGVVTAGRPVSRVFDDGRTIEITRLATDGTPNACSALLGAAWRAAKAMGYRRLIIYTRADEPGTSLHAAGLCRVADHAASSGRNTPSRPRASHCADGVAPVLWEITAGAPRNCGRAK